MNVRELLLRLAEVDPESVVLFLGEHVDSDESDEAREVEIPSAAWTYETGSSYGVEYKVWYPGPKCVREDDYVDVAYQRKHVVVLSAGPTNLRFSSCPDGNDDSPSCS